MNYELCPDLSFDCQYLTSHVFEGDLINVFQKIQYLSVLILDSFEAGPIDSLQEIQYLSVLTLHPFESDLINSS